MKLINKLIIRLFISLLFITFGFQSWTKADDIRDFEIEGMSIGDSLLDHFNIEDIKKEINSDFIYMYPGDKFLKVGVGESKDFFLIKNIDPYEDIGITIINNDEKYIIYSLQGRIFCKSDINSCLSKQKTISSDLKEVFGDTVNFEEWERAHRADKTKKSLVYGNRFEIKNSGTIIAVNVYNWSKKFTTEKNWQDHVSVSIHSKDFYDFLAGDIKY